MLRLRHLVRSPALLALLALLPPAAPTPTPATPDADDASASPLPLIIWHGLGDNYAADGIVAVGDLAVRVHPGTFVYNIRLDPDPGVDRRATFFGNLTEQLASVCREVAEHPVLGQAAQVDALGFSQGGQFLRGLVERCSGAAYESTGTEQEGVEGAPHVATTTSGRVPQVRSLVTFGAQHNGIAEFSACKSSDWLCRSAMGLLRANAWSDFVQGRVVPAQYYRTLDEETGEPSADYLEHSAWLADVNNERANKSSAYAANLAELENFVMYVFEDDETVIPKETGWFAEVNATSEEVTHLRDRKIYQEDWLGLKKLDQKGGLAFRSTPGQHMQIDEDVLEAVFKEFYGPSKASDEGHGLEL